MIYQNWWLIHRKDVFTQSQTIGLRGEPYIQRIQIFPLDMLHNAQSQLAHIYIPSCIHLYE